MTICKHCKKEMDWGRDDDGWKPLVPIADHDGLDRIYRDQDGVLRAHHSEVCTERNRPSIRVTRLRRKVKASEVAAVEAAEAAEPLPPVVEQPHPEPQKPREYTGTASGFSLFKRRKRKGAE